MASRCAVHTGGMGATQAGGGGSLRLHKLPGSNPESCVQPGPRLRMSCNWAGSPGSMKMRCLLQLGRGGLHHAHRSSCYSLLWARIQCSFLMGSALLVAARQMARESWCGTNGRPAPSTRCLGLEPARMTVCVVWKRMNASFLVSATGTWWGRAYRWNPRAGCLESFRFYLGDWFVYVKVNW